MKDVLKCIGLLVVGMSVAIVVYPFLHETGHFVVAILVGAKVIDFNLFPLPYVACEVVGLNKASLILIGLAGMFIPTIVSMIIRPKSFWLWYGSLVMKGICLLSFAISSIAIVLYRFGVTLQNEDVIQVVYMWENGIFILAVLMILYTIIIIRSIIMQSPLNRIIDYFQTSEKCAKSQNNLEIQEISDDQN